MNIIINTSHIFFIFILNRLINLYILTLINYSSNKISRSFLLILLLELLSSALLSSFLWHDLFQKFQTSCNLPSPIIISRWHHKNDSFFPFRQIPNVRETENHYEVYRTQFVSTRRPIFENLRLRKCWLHNVSNLS